MQAFSINSSDEKEGPFWAAREASKGLRIACLSPTPLVLSLTSEIYILNLQPKDLGFRV